MENYIKGELLGMGTYGKVIKVVHKESGKVYAMKKLCKLSRRDSDLSEEGGICKTILREIKVLKELQHPNILTLVEVFNHKQNIRLVCDLMEGDLETLIKNENIKFTPGDIKAYMQMLLKAVEHCHNNMILHRDLKPDNLLLAPDGTLKLADFGLARVYGSPGAKYTDQVFQRWYRAPELLFGCKSYSTPADMWAVGCIFAELHLRRPYFPGDSDLDQLSKVFAALGSPPEEHWPEMKSLPDFVEMGNVEAPDKRAVFPTMEPAALALLEG
eukprot:CAMPEP_0118928208 /NCGR_PEP_ID=MMETSP1169-20130426/5514_1 /TAXON_ID=36882 /ORGANISM="Pyramimonas obovata, Strain CCMP722" /LENGTH=270 /DNA_ID=CAMNT_0006870131 /DNA_START=312 /DNA_END=1121 /DNA_ORIENTATION=-